MERFRPILLSVWREACQHIEIHESATTIGRLLERHMPVEQLLIRRYDPEHGGLRTVAHASPRRMPALESVTPCDSSDLKRLERWANSGEVLHRGGKKLSGLLALAAPAGVEADVLAAALGSEGDALGVVVLIAHPRDTFELQHLELLAALREPLSVALENDRRLHEMAALREAAEADRQSLLRRLGRTEMADIVVGEQSGLRQVMDRVDLVAKSDVPVLILGETGTGKELIARAIHNRSQRAQGPFIRVNCGAIPPELIDSQLFGHERGSFTGAAESRQGWFERADGGTLLLDEIGELPLDAQVRFLRVLQDGYVERVGGQQPLRVDVRIVAATHRDLAQMVRETRFREDLWYRVAIFPILLPPLRERRDDIAQLARHFAERAATRFGLAAAAPGAAELRVLQEYDWPGNIRELAAVIDRAAILGDGQRLEVAKALGLTHAAVGASSNSPTPPTPRSGEPARGALATLDEAVRSHIEAALVAANGRIEGARGAAKMLAINPHTLRAKMRKLGIDWSRFRGEEATW